MNHFKTSKLISEIFSNKITNKKILSYKNIDWDKVVKITSSHLSLPALYSKLNKRNILHILPSKLKKYLKNIYDLNFNRNKKILNQLNALNNLLIDNEISFCYLKGSSTLIINLYNDLGSRMIGDIDILVSPNDYIKTINILNNNGYNANSLEIINFKKLKKNHRHYPRLINKKFICAVEIHNKCLNNEIYYLKTNNILSNKIFKKKYPIMNFEHMIYYNILNFFINDKGSEGIYNLKNIYETIELKKKLNKNLILINKKEININFSIYNIFLKEFKYDKNLYTYFYRSRLLLFFKFNFLFKIQKLLFFIIKLPILFFKKKNKNTLLINTNKKIKNYFHIINEDFQ